MCVCCATLKGVYKACCPVDTLRFNLITAGVMERKKGGSSDRRSEQDGRID